MKCGGEEWLTPQNSSNSLFIRDVLNITFDEPLLILKEVAYEWVLPIIVAVGVAGNLLNLVVLARPFIKGATKIYLTSLAVTDVCVMMFAIPMIFRLSRHFSPEKVYWTAFFHAHLELFLSLTFVTASVFIVISLTADRYLSVCLPDTFRSVHTARNAKTVVFWAYVAAVIFNFPITFLKNVCLERDKLSGNRMWNYHENIDISRTAYFKMYLTVLELGTRFVPMCLVTLLNVLIVKKLRQLTKIRIRLRPKSISLMREAEDSIYAKNQRSEEKRLVALLKATVGLYLVTMAPPAFLPFFYTEERESDFGLQLYRALANILETANCALNFYVYCFCSRDFRMAFLQIFDSCGHKKCGQVENFRMDRSRT